MSSGNLMNNTQINCYCRVSIDRLVVFVVDIAILRSITRIDWQLPCLLFNRFVVCIVDEDNGMSTARIDHNCRVSY